MSPRSEEFMEMARERLADAQNILDVAHPALIVSAAYYAMLNAANAALSERGEHAKTHSGTWTLFSKVFVATGGFDRELYGFTGRAQEARQEGDYQAKPLTPELARELLDAAERFLAAVEEMTATPTDPGAGDSDPKD
jgi:uncharacterized protein (UPF0332 family)